MQFQNNNYMKNLFYIALGGVAAYLLTKRVKNGGYGDIARQIIEDVEDGLFSAKIARVDDRCYVIIKQGDFFTAVGIPVETYLELQSERAKREGITFATDEEIYQVRDYIR